MRKWLLFFALCFSAWGFARPIQDHTIDPLALVQLASALGVEGDLIAETQKHWLRKPGQERWEMAELSPDQKRIVLNWAEQQGLFTAWQPARKEYDKALILGATTCRMQRRLDSLKQLWEEGVRFHEVVWLTGKRPLDPRIDALTDCCSTEADAAQILWEEANLPQEMRRLPVTFVAVGGVRPHTEDTLHAWLKMQPEPCTVLFLSDQPFCGYQYAIVKTTLPEEFLFDFAGQGVDPMSHPAAAAITLDAIARWIYQERQ